MDLLRWFMIAVLAGFVGAVVWYIFVRLTSSAILRSYFQMKNLFNHTKEEK